jgi:hypothetical protein
MFHLIVADSASVGMSWIDTILIVSLSLSTGASFHCRSSSVTGVFALAWSCQRSLRPFVGLFHPRTYMYSGVCTPAEYILLEYILWSVFCQSQVFSENMSRQKYTRGGVVITSGNELHFIDFCFNSGYESHSVMIVSVRQPSTAVSTLATTTK